MPVVTITYLQQLSSAEMRPSARKLPQHARIERAQQISAEFSRFLYQSVGSKLNWADRLASSREQWDATLRRAGSETYVLYQDGVPKGYAELVTEVTEAQSEVEIYYFGLFPEAIGQGLGGLLLSEANRRAWDLHTRFEDLPPVGRVWLHTCSLDGEAAIPNYQARGFSVYDTTAEETEVIDASLDLWPSS
ncbi:GNAT family acetyltransferase [Arthrobacter sp. MYb211]|uniref:GNAT family N-acetyltransferase n=1 Tax=Micrococcaceae TaxID=1268 RepID=UPI000BB94B60|nr:MULTISPECIES: GNAT family N-acetyltransferase [Micrococcaceae]PCC30118.1 GNAT family acetyltransferase [Glutamicibacter sp. BW80]PRA11260.1 GNAT family acetyltransferase [Arthrobacter sp. MYb221]PRC07567.1 GNAT family acetyltransferase [Arthrobacter sp. MYb211]